MTQPTNTAATAADGTTTTTAPAASVPTPPAQTQQATATAPDTATELAALKAEADRWKSFSRKHEDAAKATAQQLEKQQAVLAQLAEKAGVQLDGAPDPAKIAQQLSAAQESAKQRALELAVYRSAAGAGGNADALLDSRAFMAQTAGLDANDPELAAKVAALVTDAVKTNPSLAAAQQAPAGQQQVQQPQIPATSGGNFSTAPAGQRQWTQDDITRATPEELVKAMKDGLLANMGVGRGKRR